MIRYYLVSFLFCVDINLDFASVHKKREKELGQYHAAFLTPSLVTFSLQISMNVNQRVTACSNVPTLRAATPVHATSISHKILTTGKIAQVTSFFYSITEENKVVLIFDDFQNWCLDGKTSIPGSMKILTFRQNGLNSISISRWFCYTSYIVHPTLSNCVVLCLCTSFHPGCLCNWLAPMHLSAD